MKNRRKNVMPPSQRKTSFVLSYAMGGIGIGEAAIMFTSLIMCIVIIFIINIIVAIMIDLIIVLISFYLVYTDNNSGLKGWEKILRNNQYFFSKKTFDKKDIIDNLNPYKYDDEKERILLSKERLFLIKVDGKDIFKMSDSERTELIEGFSRIISSIEYPISLYKKMSEPNKTKQINYFNDLIVETAESKKKTIEDKKRIIRQLKAYAIEEILKKVNRKDSYYITLVSPVDVATEETHSLVEDLNNLNLSSTILNYKESKLFIIKNGRR